MNELKNPHKEHKLEMFISRLDFLFPDAKIRALKEYKYDWYNKRKQENIDFAKKYFSEVEYCFYLGDYCRKNRPWIADYQKWQNFSFNDNIYRKMWYILKAIITEMQIEYGETNSIIESINCKLGNFPYVIDSKSSQEDITTKRHFVDFFMIGLMNISNEDIEKFWAEKYDEINKECQETHEFFQSLRADCDSDDFNEKTDFSAENNVMDALENGNGEYYGY